MTFELTVVVILLILSGFFSASETALMTLTPAKVRTLVDAKKAGSRYLEKLKTNHHKTLITILIGNNFVNIAASALTTVLMTEYFGSAAVGIATGVLTFVVLIFGEILPKSVATNHAAKFACWVAFPLYWLEIILTPLIWFFDGFVQVTLRLFGEQKQHQVTDEELIAMASIGAEEGSIDEAERDLIENVLEFNDIHVGDIMTPRAHLDAIPEGFTLDQATEFVIHHPHSRLPVYRDSLDQVVGILYVKDLLKYRHDEEDEDEVTLRQINLQKALKVKEHLPVHELLQKFKTKRTHIALVLDTHHKVSGLITMEDILEELVGEIEDEEDLDEERIVKLGKGRYELSGRVELDELMELTGLELDFPEYKTIGFLLTEKLGRLPRKGERVQVENWEFRVTRMWRHTILKVTLRKKRKVQS